MGKVERGRLEGWKVGAGHLLQLSVGKKKKSESNTIPGFLLETPRVVRYLLLLPAAPPVRLVQEPRAEDWVHVDGYALHADEEHSSWTQ